MEVIIIGGGPAGIIAGISSAKCGNKVTILEKMNSCGKKLLITGKGRCNITNNADMIEFMENTPRNGKFLYSAFNNFTNRDIIELLEKEGVEIKVERGKRVFPKSDKSRDVLDALLKIANSLKIDIKTNSKVTEIKAEDGEIKGVYCNGEFLNADKVILATGGKSYPVTGSTGDGYKFAEKLGHSVIELKPSLVPLTSQNRICSELQGLSLKNVGIRLKDNEKFIYQDFGEMLFTHFGVSGPVILSASAYLVRHKNVDELFRNNSIKLEIDLKPALDVEKLDLRILRDFEEEKNKAFKNSLNKLLPQKLIPIIIKRSGVDGNKKVNEITKKERYSLIKQLKGLEIGIDGFGKIEEAIITSGGIDVREINPKTMESKIVKGLYFAGEIIDVDSLTGGFNLQIAWSTGYTAGIGVN